MKLIASFNGVIEQKKGRLGLDKDFRVAHIKNVPFELPDSIAEAYLATNTPENPRYKVVNGEVEEFETGPNDGPEVPKVPIVPKKALFDPEAPPTPEQLRAAAVTDPEEVLKFAEIIGVPVDGQPAEIVAEAIINYIDL